jgi:hypothetical protein
MAGFSTMTKIKQTLVSNQLNLFDLLTQERAERATCAPGRLCVSARLLSAVKLAIKEAPKSRETIADEMTELTGTEVTVGMINNWTAESHPHRMPAELLPAFCTATGSTLPLQILAEASGLFALAGPDALRADMQKDLEHQREIGKRIRQKEALIKALEGGIQ